MTETPDAAADAAVAIMAKAATLALATSDTPYEDVCDALARAGWLHDPAEVERLRARVAELEAENKRLREVGLAARAYSESTRDRSYGDPNLRWRELNDVLAYRGAALDAAPDATAPQEV